MSNCNQKKCCCNNENLCTSMPVDDAFINELTTDKIIVTRAHLNDKTCGNPTERCQTVLISIDQLVELIRERL